MFDKLKDIVSDVIGGNAPDLGNVGDHVGGAREHLEGVAEPGGVADLVEGVGFGEFSQYLEGVDFPASTGEILTQLQENGASGDLLARVQDLGQEHFAGPTELFSRLSGNR